MIRRFTLASVAALVVLVLPSAAQAAFHLTKVREVFPGTTALPNAQYVMLQMYTAGQNLVAGHQLTIYDAAGMTVGTFTFPANVANGADQAMILLATPDAATFFSVAADLVIAPVIAAAGGKVCFENIDCVSWGSFSGSALMPSPSGSPARPLTGLQIGHAIRRDISRFSPTLLQDVDDTNDSVADFDCVDTAMPINNAGASGSYTDPTPCADVCGNNLLEPGEQCDGMDDAACVGGCSASCQCPINDAVVLPVRPIQLKLRNGTTTSPVRKVRVTVRNADPLGSGNDLIELAMTHDCPPGVAVSTPAFTGGGDTVTLAGGRSTAAIVSITVTDAAFAAINKAPQRCRLAFEASTQVVGNLDPNPSNNDLAVELSVIDENDPGTASPPHESFIDSRAPLTTSITDGAATRVVKVRPTIGNADIQPVAENPGDAISVAANVIGDCTGVTVGVLDMNRMVAGNQSSLVVRGGRKGMGVLDLVFNAAAISTPNAKSPLRCTATISATGPTEPDADPTNNTTEITIDVIDRNDN